MAAISQTTSSDAFSWLKRFAFWLKFTEVSSYVSYRKYASIGLDNSLVKNTPHAIIWTNADPIHWRIYAALGGDEFMSGYALFMSGVVHLKSFRVYWYETISKYHGIINAQC